MTNYNLYHYCRRNLTERVKNILNKSKTIDVLYEKGELFNFAASKENGKIFTYLVKYFYEVQLPQIDNKYLQKDTENKLKEILEEVKSSWVITEEIEQVINKYLNPKEETRLDYLDNSSDLSLNEELINKVINQNSPRKFNELDKTADTSGGSPDSSKSGKSVFSLDAKIDMNYAKNVINHYHLDSPCHEPSCEMVCLGNESSPDFTG